MITTDAGLYGAGSATALLDRGTTALAVCGCGQELDRATRRHCPRCGCCLS